ncbi:MAG: hypothetical protein M0T84_09165 [Betaproteobacteria bacterium]|nr:hypothetical protein [Betaproteobacteria bacterium]
MGRFLYPVAILASIALAAYSAAVGDIRNTAAYIGILVLAAVLPRVVASLPSEDPDRPGD